MDYTMIILVCAILFALLSTLFICIWVYKDAKQRGLNALLWVLLVIFVSNLGGLIIYLLVGRNEKNIICGKCKSSTSASGAFCSGCGAPIEVKVRKTGNKSQRSLLILCVSCVCIGILLVGAFGVAYFNSSGFQFERKYGGKVIGVNRYINKVAESSSGDTWKLSFGDSSEGFILSKFYNAKEKVELISIDASNSNDGTIELIVTQGEKSFVEVISVGYYEFSLEDFEVGKMMVKVKNVDAIDFKGEIKIK